MNLNISTLKKSAGSFMLALLLVACSSQKAYQVAGLKGSRTVMTDVYDKRPDKAMQEFVAGYKVQFDKAMNVQIATSDLSMQSGRPESLLTNLTSDQLKRFGDNYLKTPCDLAFMNVHGHRAGMPKGVVTLDNLYEIYPFDNTVVLVKLKGKDLTTLFESYIEMGGAGISSNVRLVGIGGKLHSALVDGKPVDPDKIYTISTIDYLADGNDGMAAMRNALEVKKTGVALRDMMIDYVKQQTKEGKNLHSQLDGRILISK